MALSIEKFLGKKEVGDMTPDQLGNWYLDQAMAFEKSKTQNAIESKKLAWRCNIGLMALMGITIMSSAYVVFNNKPNPPGVIHINDVTGEVKAVKTLSDGKITYGEATGIANLRRYVNYRESYDWDTIQDLYNATILLSNAHEGNIYASFNGVENKAAPVNVLTDKYRVIAKAGTITFVGKTALVSFTKTMKPQNGMPSSTDYFVATISYEYENAPLNDTDRGINPEGFKVTSYRVDRDITKTTAVQSEAGSEGAKS